MALEDHKLITECWGRKKHQPFHPCHRSELDFQLPSTAWGQEVQSFHCVQEINGNIFCVLELMITTVGGS